MTEYLHTKLVDTLKASGINPALSEDEIDSYPYVTFELPVEYRYTKDGPYKIVGNLTIRSVSDDFDEADALRASIESSIDAGFNGHTNESEAIDVFEPDGPEEEIADGVMEADADPEPGDPVEEEPADPAEHDPDDPGAAQESGEDIQETEHEYDVYHFSARITDVRKDCMDGVWVIELDYILNQYE